MQAAAFLQFVEKYTGAIPSFYAFISSFFQLFPKTNKKKKVIFTRFSSQTFFPSNFLSF